MKTIDDMLEELLKQEMLEAMEYGKHWLFRGLIPEGGLDDA